MHQYESLSSLRSREHNLAFIDGQNLHMGTQSANWLINYTKFRTYLRDKYQIKEAYYFLGFVDEDQQDLYDRLQKAGYILRFREHSALLKGNKKGNVDCDIVFAVMRSIVEQKNMDKIFIISGDGDYKRMVDYLVKKKVFGKMLFPNKKYASSLYKKRGSEYYDNLENKDVKKKIEYKHK